MTATLEEGVSIICVPIAEDGDALVHIANLEPVFQVHSLVLSNASPQLKQLVDEAKTRALTESDCEAKPLAIEMPEEESYSVQIVLQILHDMIGDWVPTVEMLLTTTLLAIKYGCMTRSMLNLICDWLQAKSDLEDLTADDHWRLLLCSFVRRHREGIELWSKQLMQSHGIGSFNDPPSVRGIDDATIAKLRGQQDFVPCCLSDAD